MHVLELMKQVFEVFSLSSCLSLPEILLINSLILGPSRIGNSQYGREMAMRECLLHTWHRKEAQGKAIQHRHCHPQLYGRQSISEKEAVVTSVLENLIYYRVKNLFTVMDLK